MSVILSKIHETEKVTIASAYASALYEAMQADSMVVDLEADLGRSLLGGLYVEMRDKLPGQFIDCGIQEANMMSVAAGLSAMGRTAFIHTFASFAARRIADQAFISGCYSGANVRIIGSDPGITAQFNGGTHMPFEDVSIYRAFPGMTIIDPCDSVLTADLTSQLAKTKGMYYIRMFRKNAVKIYEEGSTFTIGKANLLREGEDVTLIACGAVMVAEALKAADLLAETGVSARVLDMFTIKPLDGEAVLAAARETGAIVTCENHNVVNGLGSAVADVLATKRYAPLEMIGVRDQFGEVGPMDYLKERFSMRAQDIAQAAKRAIARKSL